MVGENLCIESMEAALKLWKEQDRKSLVKFIGVPPLQGKQYVGTGWVQEKSWK